MNTVSTMPSVKEKRKAMQLSAEATIAHHNLRVVHVRSMTHNIKGGCTVVYGKAASIDNMIAVAVAVVNNKDSYCRYIGRYTAAERWNNGERIMLRVPKNMKAGAFLRYTFACMVDA